MTISQTKKWRYRRRKGYVEVYDAATSSHTPHIKQWIDHQLHKFHINGWTAVALLGVLFLALTSVAFSMFFAITGTLLLGIGLVMLIAAHHHHGHISFSFRFAHLFQKEKGTTEEDKIASHVSEVIKKHKLLQVEQNKLKKEIDSLYNRAGQLNMEKTQTKLPPGIMESELRTLLRVVDILLEKLPDKEINSFIASKDYQLYKKVLQHYNIR